MQMLWRTLPPLAVLVGVGCTPSGPPTVTVTGTVKLGSKTVPSGMVTFHGPESRVATALIQPDGTYVASSVSPGANKVTVTGIGAATPGGAKGFTVVLPPRYADVNQSGLSLEVKPGGQEYPIELK
jgi:hypothetical protein